MEMTAIRASSLPELFDCPARWEAKHLCGRRLPRSAAAQLGTAVHAGAAVFDVQRILGSPITPDDAAGEVVDAIHHPKEDVDWGEDSPREAERIALALHGLYCRNIAPARNYVAVEATCERLVGTEEQPGLLQMAARMIRSGDFYGNPKSQTCTEKYCPVFHGFRWRR